jgi:hypothetical protein
VGLGLGLGAAVVDFDEVGDAVFEPDPDGAGELFAVELAACVGVRVADGLALGLAVECLCLCFWTAVGAPGLAGGM